jgi:hypothetical protein
MVLHQFAKDLRLLKWHVVAWVAAVSAANITMLAVAGTWFPSFEVVDRVSFVEMLLGMAATTTLAVTVASLVQQDGPVSTTAFWTTRPAPLVPLLAGKILFALVALALVPLLWDAISLSVFGVSPAWISPVAIAVVLAWVFVPMTAAAVTATLPQFFLIALFEVVVFGAAVGIASAFGVRANATTPMITGLAVIAAVMSGAVVACAYFTRCLKLSAALVGIGPLVLFAIAALAWPYDSSALWRSDYERPYSGHVAVEVDKQAMTADEVNGGLDIVFPLRVHDLGPGTKANFASNYTDDSWLQSSSRRIKLNLARSWTDARPEDAASIRGFLTPILGTGTTILNPSMAMRPPELFYSVRVPRADYRQYSNEPVNLHLAFALRLIEWRPATTLRLEPGAGCRYDGGALRIGDVKIEGDRSAPQVRATVRATHPSPLRTITSASYFLRNRTTREAIAGRFTNPTRSYNRYESTFSHILPMMQDLSVEWYTLAFELRFSESAKAGGAAKWLADSELVIVTSRFLGTTEVELDVPGVRMSELPTTPELLKARQQ